MGTNERKKTANVKQAAFLIVVVATLAVAVVAYARSLGKTESVRVSFVNHTGAVSGIFSLEVAAEEATRAKGLMFKKAGEVPEKGGMLFVFPQEKKQMFYMKNTYIPLDMVFIDRGMKVVGVLENVPVLNDTPRGVDAKSQYVIELLGGTAKKYDIKAGTSVQFSEAVPQAK